MSVMTASSAPHRFRTEVEAEAWLNAAADELGISKIGIRRLITSGGLKGHGLAGKQSGSTSMTPFRG